ncbi:hypothetical protein RCL1_008192 [Eukaryota sp. TZLM3-RCL]
MSWIDDLFDLVKDIHKVFKNIAKTRHWYIEMGGKELRSFAVIRFAYVILLLQGINESRTAMMSVVKSGRYSNLIETTKKTSRRNLLLKVSRIVRGVEGSIAFWSTVALCLNFCSPWISLLRLADTGSAGFISFFLWAYNVTRSLSEQRFGEQSHGGTDVFVTNSTIQGSSILHIAIIAI